MIQKKSVFESLDIAPSGIVQIRIGIVVLDGDEIIARKNHRSMIEPGIAVSDQMTMVNAHLASMNEPEVGADEIARLDAIVAVVHTPEVIAAYQAAQEAA